MKKNIKIKAIIALILVAVSMAGCSVQKKQIRPFDPRLTNTAIQEERFLKQANQSAYDVKTAVNSIDSNNAQTETINIKNGTAKNTNSPASVFNVERKSVGNTNSFVGSNYNAIDTTTVPTILPTESLKLTTGNLNANFDSNALPAADANCEHNWTYTNKTIHHDAETHTETVAINEPWDEKVLVKAAWDEKVITKNAWDEKKLVRDAWDEKVLIKAAYDETVKNGYSFVETVWLQGCDGNAAALGYSSPYDYLRDYYSNEDKYYLEYDSGYKTYPEKHFVNTYNEASDLVRTNGNVNGFVSGGWYNVYAYNSYTISHEAEYKTVHHNAEYKTIHHNAEYDIVHHDAEYKMIHHDTKYEKKTVVDKPAYDTYQTIFKCSKCQKTY